MNDPAGDPDALHRETRRLRAAREAGRSPGERVLRAYRLFCLWRGAPGGDEVDAMKELQDVLEALADPLDAHGIPFAVGGAFALAAHGTPRFTYNLDVMVAADLDRVHAALADPGLERLSAVSYRETTTDLLVDLHPVREAAQRWAFEGAESIEVAGREVAVLSPEGLAVMLLREAAGDEEDVRPLRLRDVELLSRRPGLEWPAVLEQVRRFGYERAYEDVDAPDKAEP